MYARIALGHTCRLRYFSISQNTPCIVASVWALHVITFLRRSGVAACGRMNSNGQEIDGKVLDGKEETVVGLPAVEEERSATGDPPQHCVSRPLGRPSMPPDRRRGEGGGIADGTTKSWATPLGHRGGRPHCRACLQAIGETVYAGDPRLQVAGEAVRVGEARLHSFGERQPPREAAMTSPRQAGHGG
jgi:hypothetical protein